MSSWQEQFKAQMESEGVKFPDTDALAQQTQALGLNAVGESEGQFNTYSPRGRGGGYRGRGRGNRAGFAGAAPDFQQPPPHFQQRGGYIPRGNHGSPAYSQQNYYGPRGDGFTQQANTHSGYQPNQFSTQSTSSPRGGGFHSSPRGGMQFGGPEQQQFKQPPPQFGSGAIRGSPRGARGFSNISKTFAPVRNLAGFKAGGNLPEISIEQTLPPENPMSSEDLALLNKFLKRTVEHMREGTVDVKNQQQDPTSPLHSILNFRELRIRDDIIKALDLMGFEQPSKIQEFALPLLLMEPPTNMIAQSQSGTGKTAAFVLTMLSRVAPENKFPQILCLAPTYELAQQIGKVVKDMSRFMPEVHVHFAVKGQHVEPGMKVTEQIVIGTPGKLEDYIFSYSLFDISKIKCVVLDEADVMISQKGHKEISIKIYNAVQAANPKVQALLFSATYEDDVIKFAEELIKNAVTVTLRKEEQALPNIKQFYVECASRDAKYDAIVNLYSGLTIASAIIFCHTIQSASWIANKLTAKGLDVALLHGQLSVEERATAIRHFREGFYKVLITTNVCARGIDVSQVSIVINYDPPVRQITNEEGLPEVVPDYETYLHRIGRTGRFGKSGIAINFADSKQVLKYIEDIQTYFEKPIVKLEPADLEQLEAIENDGNEGEEEEDEEN